MNREPSGQSAAAMRGINLNPTWKSREQMLQLALPKVARAAMAGVANSQRGLT